MVEYLLYLRLGGSALGALGALLLFVEFFQQPSYVEYKPRTDRYDLEYAPDEVREHTWVGRTGALLVAVAFATQFFVALGG